MPHPLATAFHLKPAAAIEHFRRKGFATSWNWYDVWQEAHDQAFTVAKVMSADILQDIKDEVDRAIADGTTFADFKKNLIPTLQRKGWWGEKEIDGKKVTLGTPRRLETIFRANANVAYSRERWNAMTETAARRPWLRYVAVLDNRTRSDHRALHGKVFRIDDPIWQTHYPPNGFNCRCLVVSMSDRDIERKGITPDSSDGNMVSKNVLIGDKDNPRKVKIHGIKTTTGDGQPVTVWTEPGWDHNVGTKSFTPELKKYDRKIAKNLKKSIPPTVGAQRVAPSSPSSEFIPDGFAKRFGADTLPVKFWDNIGQKIDMVVKQVKKTCYLPGKKFVQIGLKRTGKNPEVRKFIAVHEFAHAYFDTVVSTNSAKHTAFKSVMDIARKEFAAMGIKVKSDFKDTGNVLAYYTKWQTELSGQLSKEEITEKSLAVADLVASLTGRRIYGFGHTRSYFALERKRETEFHSHMAEFYFAKNPILEKYFPETAAATKEFFEKEMKSAAGQAFAAFIEGVIDGNFKY